MHLRRSDSDVDPLKDPPAYKVATVRDMVRDDVREDLDKGTHYKSYRDIPETLVDPIWSGSLPSTFKDVGEVRFQIRRLILSRHKLSPQRPQASV